MNGIKALVLCAVLLTAGCAMSPPKPPVCDGHARKPINGRVVADAPIKQSKETTYGYGCTSDA